MSLFVPFRRATLLVPSGPGGNPDQKHLFILLTNPVPNAANGKDVLLVGLSSVRAGGYHDPACLLYPGDHPFLVRQSYVNYRMARIEDAQKLINGVRTGVLAPKEVLAGEIFARVCHGLTESRHTAPKILEFYQVATV
jgi:hypothetical protein